MAKKYFLITPLVKVERMLRMLKTMVLITILGWLVANGAVQADGGEEVNSSAGPVKSREFNVISSFEAKGNETLSGFYLLLSPSARPLYRGGFAVEVSPQGSRLVWYPLEGTAIGLTPYGGPKWTAGTTYKLAMQRDNETISGTVDGLRLGPVTITDPAQKQLLEEPQRFKFYGWQGGLYTIQNAILQDGPP